MVFQSYALWPHMTVRKNIGYPLRTRAIKRDQASEWIEEVAGLVDTTPLLDRYPAQLSGGQQQRIALARGLVARPELVLFDEPLSNLDARLRDQVRTEIHELHARLGFTAVYVTHDQVEALALGDRLAIMRAGALEQLATPDDIFEEPATEYVASFIGMANRLEFERHDGSWWLEGERVDGDLDASQAARHASSRARVRRTSTSCRRTPRRRAEPIVVPGVGRRRRPSAAGTSTSRSRSARRACSAGSTPASAAAGRGRSSATSASSRSLNPRDLAFYDADAKLVSGVGRPVGSAPDGDSGGRAADARSRGCGRPAPDAARRSSSSSSRSAT